MKILINFATSQMLLSLTSGFLLSYRPRGATFLQPKRTIKDSVLFAENRRSLLQNIASFGALASQGMLLTSGSEKASALVEGNPVPKKAKALPGKCRLKNMIATAVHLILSHNFYKIKRGVPARYSCARWYWWKRRCSSRGIYKTTIRSYLCRFESRKRRRSYAR